MIWFRNFIYTAGSIVVTGLIGLWSPWLAFVCLALAFGAFAGWHLLFMQRLYSWTTSPGQGSVPVGRGIWGDIFDRLARFMTTQGEARAALKDEIEEIRQAVDRLPDGLVVLDAANNVQWCNVAARELHGIFANRRPVLQFIRSPDFQRYLLARNYSSPLEIELSSRPGRTHEFRIHQTDEDTRLLISRDVTEHAMLNQMRSDFVANVSHEIRTPVTVIGGFAETMLDLELDRDKQREYLESILHNSHTMQSLVEDLLILSSLEATSREGLDESISLTSMFALLAGEARDLSKGQHEIIVEPPGEVVILGRQQEIESAIRNFLTNAVRYTPDSGTIRLSWTMKGREGWLTVRDDGIGIAPEHLPRLTERFYRVDRGRSRSTGGTGLGLAIVKRIANRHAMSLHVDSRIGKGSAFTIIVPATRIRQATAKGNERANEVAGAAPRRP